MDETLLEILGDRLTDKIQKANTLFLTKIGESIKKIGTLTPTQAHQLIQMLKYSGDYEELISQLSSLTGIDPMQIDEIFSSYSKNDLNFAKKFYEYRNKPFTPFDENIPLKRQTEALANITKNAMANFTRSRALGYMLSDINGKLTFYGLRETYEKVLDEALLNITQGKEGFNQSMTKIMKELGQSGLRTLDYASGRHYRLDSMVRMHLQDGIRELHNENQRLLGEEFGADGVEITVHENPAEDHQDAQGRQFSYSEFSKLQEYGMATDYTGKQIIIHLQNKSGELGLTHRPISDYNCKHSTYSIVLGVSKPQHSEEKLQQIIDDNKKGFEFEGKHYTNYEGTQLQRAIERKIREQKDIQIGAKAEGNNELVGESQLKITQLTRKYKELSNISGLPTQAERMRVSGYKRMKVETVNKDKYLDFNAKNYEELDKIGREKFNFASNTYLDSYISQTSRIKERIESGDVELKERLDILEPKINELSQPSPFNFTLYSAKDINVDYSKEEHLLSTTISEPIANMHINKAKNKEIITIYVDKGANIISTYNTTSRHFTRQGEIIIPSKRKMIRINKYTYILKK